MHFMVSKSEKTQKDPIGAFVTGSNWFLLGRLSGTSLFDTFLNAAFKNGASRPVSTYILSVYGYNFNIYFMIVCTP